MDSDSWDTRRAQGRTPRGQHFVRNCRHVGSTQHGHPSPPAAPSRSRACGACTHTRERVHRRPCVRVHTGARVVPRVIHRSLCISASARACACVHAHYARACTPVPMCLVPCACVPACVHVHVCTRSNNHSSKHPSCHVACHSCSSAVQVELARVHPVAAATSRMA